MFGGEGWGGLFASLVEDLVVGKPGLFGSEGWGGLFASLVEDLVVGGDGGGSGRG